VYAWWQQSSVHLHLIVGLVFQGMLLCGLGLSRWGSTWRIGIEYVCYLTMIACVLLTWSLLVVSVLLGQTILILGVIWLYTRKATAALVSMGQEPTDAALKHVPISSRQRMSERLPVSVAEIIPENLTLQ
jgi:hypothetical protein